MKICQWTLTFVFLFEMYGLCAETRTAEIIAIEDANSLGDVTVHAVSHDGTCVAGGISGTRKDGEWNWTPSRAFLWKAGEFQILGCLPGKNSLSVAHGVSNSGDVVVGSSDPDHGHRAFRWTPNTGMTELLSPMEYPDGSDAMAVSADGSVIVGHVDWQAFVWTEKTGIVKLDFFPNARTGVVGMGFKLPWGRANAVSADGKTVVGGNSIETGELGAFRWTESEGMVALGFLPLGFFQREKERGSVAYGVSADGTIVVGESSSKRGNQAFYWTRATGMVGLGDINKKNFHSRALAVSDDGKVIIGESMGKDDKAFIWTPDKGIRDLREVLIDEYKLPLEKWKLTSARSISGDGTVITGQGENPDGNPQGWIIRFN